MSEGIFTVAGVSTQHGITKVRFANDLASRVKLLAKGGHNSLKLVQLPKAMTKAEACQYLLSVGGVFEQWTALISETMGKKSGAPATQTVKAPKQAKAPVKAAKAKVVKPKQPKVIVAPQAEDEDLEIEELKQIAA